MQCALLRMFSQSQASVWIVGVCVSVCVYPCAYWADKMSLSPWLTVYAVILGSKGADGEMCVGPKAEG